MLIAQLSDLHVRPAGQLYKGVADSNRALRDAIAHLHGLDRRPDLVLITGDLVDEGRPEEYAMLAALLQTLAIPYRVLPGNHDERQAFRQAFRGHAYLGTEGPVNWCLDEQALRIVAFDACPPGLHHGQAEPASLQWLQATLAAGRTRPTLLLMHHPPFVSGIPYLDEYRYRDAAPLEALVAGFDQVQAVLCGHVHRVMFRRWGGTVVAACPSTTTQIALQLQPDASPQSFIGPAACLLHLWQPEHGLVSHVSHIDPAGASAGPFPFF